MLQLDLHILMLIGLALVARAFFAAVAMNGVLGPAGFGVTGNMLVMIAGAMIGIYLRHTIQWTIPPETAGAVSAVAGAFIGLALLTFLKNMLIRAGF